MAILEQKRQAVDAASRALCFVRRRRPCVRSSDPRRISALDSPSIRGTRNQNSKARTRFSWPGWACGTDLTTSRDFYETQNIHSSPNLSGKPSPPNQIKQENSATAVLCEGVSLPHQPNGCIVTVPPGSSRDLTAGDAHPGVPCRSSHCSPAPGWTGARRGGSLSTRTSRPALPLSLQRSFFPRGFPPSSSPLLRRGHTTSYRGRVRNDLRYFRIFLPDTVSPGVKAHEITKVFFQEMLKEIFGKSFPRPRGSLTRPLPSPPASSSSSSFRKVDPLKCVPPEPTGTLELQGFKPKPALARR